MIIIITSNLYELLMFIMKHCIMYTINVYHETSVNVYRETLNMLIMFIMKHYICIYVVFCRKYRGEICRILQNFRELQGIIREIGKLGKCMYRFFVEIWRIVGVYRFLAFYISVFREIGEQPFYRRFFMYRFLRGVVLYGNSTLFDKKILSPYSYTELF